MNMKLPSWVDEQLSSDLPVLRSQGEGQHCEFKKKFPEKRKCFTPWSFSVKIVRPSPIGGYDPQKW